MKYKTFPIQLSADLHQALKIAAINAGMTLQGYCIKVLADHVGK